MGREPCGDSKDMEDLSPVTIEDEEQLQEILREIMDDNLDTVIIVTDIDPEG